MDIVNTHTHTHIYIYMYVFRETREGVRENWARSQEIRTDK